MLTGLGLSAAAESVYRAMLLHPRAGVAAIAATTGDSEAEVREALDELSELALVRASAEDEGRLRVVSPDIGMEILMARRQAELAAEQQRLEASRAAAAQLISEYAELRPATPHPGVEQLIGLDAVRDRLVVLTRELKEELMAFSPDSALTESAITSSRPLNEELLARGVRMRTIYLDSVRNSRPSIEHANWLAELGGQVRTVAALPTRMLIVDRGTAVIPVSSDNTAAGAVVLTGQGMLTALCALFEATWAAAHPLAESTTR
ncbi:TrmB family transcriptional regulator, partial [Streptomyces clavuligerus]